MNNQLDSSFVGYSVSSATLRLCDILPAALDFITDHDPGFMSVIDDEYLADINEHLYALPVDRCYQYKLGWYRTIPDYVYQLKSMGDLGNIPDDHPIWSFDNTHLDWLYYEDIYDRLNEIAPNFCYFGAHIGDGADIGFWTVDYD